MAILKHPEKDAVRFARGKKVRDLHSLQSHLALCQECSELVLFVHKFSNLLKATQAGQPRRPDINRELEAVGLDRKKASELLEGFAEDQWNRKHYPNVDVRTLLQVADLPRNQTKIGIRILDVHPSPKGSREYTILDIKNVLGKTAWAVPPIYVGGLRRLYGSDLQDLIGRKLQLTVVQRRQAQTGQPIFFFKPSEEKG